MPDLAPLRVRLIVFAVLILLALASIWLIDRRAVKPASEQNTSRAVSAHTLVDYHKTIML